MSSLGDREAWVVVGHPSADTARHLAWDLLSRLPPQLRVAPVRDVAVVLPASRDPQREVFLGRCLADGVSVVRRPSGGGAVVLAPGVVTLSALIPLGRQRGVEWLFGRWGGLLIDGLARLGVRGLALRGVSDLCLGQRKLVGTSLRLQRTAVLFQASLLVSCSLELIERYLPYPSRAPEYRQGRSHQEFLTTLRQEGYVLSPEQVAAGLFQVFSRALVMAEGSG